MTTILKGARPIRLAEVLDHYQQHQFQNVNLDQYAESWKNWLVDTKLKNIKGLDKFIHVDYTCGTSQTFDHFVMRHASKQISVLRGDFQYHACISKSNNFSYIDNDNLIGADQAIIISLPFSDLGTEHPKFKSILDQCNQHGVSVCLDLAYWGIAKNVSIDFDQYPCIVEVTASLSKPFYVLENHRVGVRFCKNYPNDGVSMLNQVNMQNIYSMSLGIHFMEKFSADWLWQKLNHQYQDICTAHQLVPTDTIIFALGDEQRHKEFKRGIDHNFRICISDLFNTEKT